MTDNFWDQPLASLNDTQWESLCDGCGQCCLSKLQDDETDEIFATDVVCRFHDIESGACSVYAQRSVKKPDCFVIDRNKEEHYSWLPKTCAYRLRFEDKPLPDWHPLITGNRQAMVLANITVGNWCVSESEVAEQDLAEHVLFSLKEYSASED